MMRTGTYHHFFQRGVGFVTLLLMMTGCQTIQFERPHVLSERDWPTDGQTESRSRAVADSLMLPLEEVWKYGANAGFGAGSPLVLQDRVLVGNRKERFTPSRLKRVGRPGSNRWVNPLKDRRSFMKE